jgi:hypothetical protein
MVASSFDLSNKIASAFNLLPQANIFNESDVVAMVVQAITDSVKGKCEETVAHLGELLNTFPILNRHRLAPHDYFPQQQALISQQLPVEPSKPPPPLFHIRCPHLET